MDLSLTLTLNIPQLDTLGDKLVASLADIGNKLTEVEQALVSEVEQIKQALLNGAEAQVLVDRLDVLKSNIMNIMPDAPTVP